MNHRPTLVSHDGLPCHGWLPYHRQEFLRLLHIAIDARGMVRPAFCDMGCGRGDRLTDAMVAGCGRAYGVDHDPMMVMIANRCGLMVTLGDVRDYPDCQLADIVYVNCPFINDADEAPFERWLQSLIQPGAVLIQVNDCGPPVGPWETLLDERGAWRGVWRRT